jgi:hypothetical protein
MDGDLSDQEHTLVSDQGYLVGGQGRPTTTGRERAVIAAQDSSDVMQNDIPWVATPEAALQRCIHDPHVPAQLDRFQTSR